MSPAARHRHMSTGVGTAMHPGTMTGSRRATALLAMLVLLGTAGDAAAQTMPAAPDGAEPTPPSGQLDDQGELPPGHPPIDNMQNDTGDEEAAPQELPPGHPPVGGSPAAMGAPVRGRTFSVDDPSLPAGTISLLARAASGKPPVGAAATLMIRHQTVATGTTTTAARAALDAQGRAQFTGLTIGSEWVYSVSLDYGGVSYDVPMFQLDPRAGKRVEMNVYQTTENIDGPPVGVQAIVYMEPQETAFQVEELFRFANVGNETWRCTGLTVNLPAGFKAFSQDEEHGSMEATEATGRGVALSGYVPPGTTQVIIRYQLPFPDTDSARYEFGLPPRVGQLRVIGAFPPGMGLRVDNLPPPENQEGNDGRNLKITETAVPVGGDQIEEAVVNLTGLPTKPPTRWYALGLTIVAVVSGVAVALRRRERGDGDDREAQWETSRKALLEELEGLERARRGGDIGPRTYEQARRSLINQLASLLAARPEPSKAER